MFYAVSIEVVATLFFYSLLALATLREIKRGGGTL